MKKKEYEVPLTRYLEVEMEQGFMSASMFEDGNKHDEGVSIEGHSIGNSGNYFDGKNPENPDDPTWNTWN